MLNNIFYSWSQVIDPNLLRFFFFAIFIFITILSLFEMFRRN